MKEETKEKTKNFMDKVKKVFDRGIVASKKALGVAGDAVQDFSDKSVLRIEKMQLESKLKKQYELLGEYASDTFAKKNSIAASDTKVSAILKEIKRIKAEIKARETALASEGAVKPSAGTAAKTSAKTSVKPAAKKAAAKPASKKASSAKTPAKTTAKKSTAAKKTSAKK